MHPPSRIRWFFLASTALSVAVAWGLAFPLLAAAVLAFVSERPIDYLLVKLRRQHSRRVRWVVASGFVLVILAGLLLPLAFAAVAAVQEMIGVLSSVDWDKATTWGTGYVDWVRNRVGSLGLEIPEREVSGRIREALTTSFAVLGTRLGALIRSTPTLAFDVLILIVAWVVFAVEGRAARDRVLPRLLPWEHEREILRKTTGEVLRSVLVANVVVSVVQATLCSVGLLIVQMPRALVWGTLSFFLSFVPVVGTMPITIGAAIYCYSQGRVGGAIFMVAVAAVIGIVDNILRPIFMKSSAELSFLWTFVAFIGGVALFGLPGVLVGPLAFSLFIAYLRAMEVLSPAAGDKASPPTDPAVDAAIDAGAMPVAIVAGARGAGAAVVAAVPVVPVAARGGRPSPALPSAAPARKPANPKKKRR